MKTRTQRGFTLIELLVVIAIIGVLIALLLPAVQSAREAARRAQCTNNLKQIGIALHNYESTTQSLPIGDLRNATTGYGQAMSPGSPCGQNIWVSWMTFILPYVEQGSQSAAYNFDVAATWFKNRTARTSAVSSFICPSDSLADDVMDGWFTTYQTSYAGMAGLTDSSLYTWSGTTNADRCNAIQTEGPFGRNYSYKFSHIRDGLSNTILIGETSRFINEPAGSHFNFGASGGAWGGPVWGGTRAWDGDVRITGLAYAVPRINAGPVIQTTAQPPYSGGVAYACMRSGGPIASRATSWANTPAPYGCTEMGQWGFRSQHPGGANFLFGDGSVRFLKETINMPTYRALSTRKGGEVTSADQL